MRTAFSKIMRSDMSSIEQHTMRVINEEAIGPWTKIVHRARVLI